MKRILELISSYKSVFQNFTYLTLLQVFNLFFPLIIYPYFINLFGLDLWGNIILAQSIVLYSSIFIDFGFDRYATREISIYRNDLDKLSEIVSNIISIRLFLGIVVFILYTIIIVNLPFFKNRILLYILFFGINFNFILFPKWFFQGIEQMKFIVIINVSVKILFVFLMLFFIVDKTDYLYVPLFFSLGSFFGGLIGLIILFKKYGITFKIYSLKMYYSYLTKSFLLFASSFVISIKDRFNVFFVGYFLGMQEVAIYDIGIKLISLITQPIDSINGAIFPRVSKSRDMVFVKKIALYSLFFVVFMIVLSQIFLTQIYSFLNIEEVLYLNSVRLMLISAVFLTLSVFLARNCFIVFNKFNLLFRSMVGTTIFYLVLIVILVLTKKTSFNYIAIVILLVYFFEFIFRFYLALKHKLIKNES